MSKKDVNILTLQYPQLKRLLLESLREKLLSLQPNLQPLFEDRAHAVSVATTSAAVAAELHETAFFNQSRIGTSHSPIPPWRGPSVGRGGGGDGGSGVDGSAGDRILSLFCPVSGTQDRSAREGNNVQKVSAEKAQPVIVDDLLASGKYNDESLEASIKGGGTTGAVMAAVQPHICGGDAAALASEVCRRTSEGGRRRREVTGDAGRAGRGAMRDLFFQLRYADAESGQLLDVIKQLLGVGMS